MLSPQITYPGVYRDDSVVENNLPIKIKDPYRWLEDPDSDQTRAFVKAQNQITSQYLSSCPYTDKIKDKLTSMWNFERFTCPMKYGSYYYYWYNTGLQNQSVLYQMETLTATPKVFLDPNSIDPDGLASIRGYSFSEDGTFLCYGISHGGSDWCELKFKVCKTGEDLPDELKHVKFSSISWTHDEKGIFYCMYLEHQGKADGTETTANTNQKLMYHLLGNNQSQDILCVENPDHPKWITEATVSDCGNYVFIAFMDGCEPKNQLHYCDLRAVGHKITTKLNLVPIVDQFEAEYEYITNDDSLVTLRTNLDSPMYKLIKIDLNNPTRENWKDLIPHDNKVLIESAVCLNQNQLIVSRLEDVKSQLSLHELSSGLKIRDIQLPLGTVWNVSARKRDTLAFVHFTSFLTPGIIFSYDLSQKDPQLVTFRQSKVENVDLCDFDVKQVFYQSKDGTKIPMFIVFPRGFKQDGVAPCNLYGYGGFNHSVSPSFSVSRILFLKHFGGIFAIANIRGGGEYGQTWHDAGRRANKQNSFDDFQSAAQYLIDQKYTNNQKLYINGGSNGGLLVCACLNQRPDLFAAGVAQVPVCDMLRFHKFTIGHAWVSDYGDPDNVEDFKVLIKYSPLHNVRKSNDPHVQYPAVLILTADHDDRVVPLHSYKFIATLQHEFGHDASNQTNPLLIRIETKAGHGAGKPTSKVIDEWTDIYAFLQLSLSLTWQD